MDRGHDQCTTLQKKSITKEALGLMTILTGGHLQMKPCGVLLATAHVPPFLQGLPLQPSNTLSQRWPEEQKHNLCVTNRAFQLDTALVGTLLHAHKYLYIQYGIHICSCL